MSIKEILDTAPLTNYKGSEATYTAVKAELEKRYGSKLAKQFDPRKNMRTYSGWAFIGFRPRKLEKPIQSVTYIEKKDAEGNVLRKFPRTIYLFFINQVEKV